MILYPGCKINIGLDITARRADGYHDIETVMVPVGGLCDILEIIPAPDAEFSMTLSGLAVDCPVEDNICVKAYHLMRQEFGAGAVKMHLHKRTPFGAGLGGGSADGAYVIKGLNELFRLGLCREDMEAAAARLGSDTVFFIGESVALARGRGEILEPFPLDLDGCLLVVVKPQLGISTAEAYSGITPRKPDVPLAKRLAAGREGWREGVVNAFEQHLLPAYPVLEEIKEEFYRAGAFYSSLSGSGSAMFGLFDPNQTDRQDLQGGIAARMKKAFPELFVYQEIVNNKA